MTGVVRSAGGSDGPGKGTAEEREDSGDCLDARLRKPSERILSKTMDIELSAWAEEDDDEDGRGRERFSGSAFRFRFGRDDDEECTGRWGCR